MTLDGKDYSLRPHEARILYAIRDREGEEISGPLIKQGFPEHLEKKNIGREIGVLRKRYPDLEELIISTGSSFHLARGG